MTDNSQIQDKKTSVFKIKWLAWLLIGLFVGIIIGFIIGTIVSYDSFYRQGFEACYNAWKNGNLSQLTNINNLIHK